MLVVVGWSGEGGWRGEGGWHGGRFGLGSCGDLNLGCDHKIMEKHGIWNSYILLKIL